MAGLYSPSLRVVDTNGCVSTVTKIDTIDVSYVDVKFTATPRQGCLPPNGQYPVQFTDQSVPSANAPITSYLWDFGDSLATSGNPNTSTQQNPSHIYTGDGRYTVKLTVTNAYGCVYTKIDSQYIKVYFVG